MSTYFLQVSKNKGRTVLSNARQSLTGQHQMHSCLGMHCTACTPEAMEGARTQLPSALPMLVHMQLQRSGQHARLSALPCPTATLLDAASTAHHLPDPGSACLGVLLAEPDAVTHVHLHVCGRNVQCPWPARHMCQCGTNIGCMRQHCRLTPQQHKAATAKQAELRMA